jgi:hypothetical protein
MRRVKASICLPNWPPLTVLHPDALVQALFDAVERAHPGKIAELRPANPNNSI